MRKARLLALMVMFFMTAHGQTGMKSAVYSVTGTEFFFGAKGGINLTDISHVLNRYKLSFHLGGLAEFQYNDFIGFQAELLYSRQGDCGKQQGDKFIFRMNYLNIPLLCKLYLVDGLSFELGPQVGFLLNNKQKVKSGGVTTITDINHVNTVDISFASGFSYLLPDSDMFVSLRYNLGLTNVMKKGHFDDNTNQNRVFQLSLGWRM